jgi:polar amino acid transport system substrate-binding protein
MKRAASRSASLILVAAVAAVATAVALSGCAVAPPAPKVVPKVKPPAIGKAGVLRAVIDLSYPPFGGAVKEVKAGLDVDVASAVADQLGLKLEIVDAKPEAGAKLLRDRKADVMLAGLRIDQAIQYDVAFAGTYINDGPAVFSTQDTSITLEALAGRRIAVQRESATYWFLADQIGEDTLVVLPSLLDALTAAASGQVDFAAGDGIVGVYMLRGFPTLKINGQPTPAVPLGVAVGKDTPDLEQAVRKALDTLAAQGVLETLRRKWMGDFPRLNGASDASGTTPAVGAP